MDPLVTVNEAEERINNAIVPLPNEDCALPQAQGRILRESIHADRDLPPYNRVTMDGYALRFQDLSKTDGILKCHKMQHAGDERIELGDFLGDCVQVMTGSILPKGADCIIPVEWTETEGSIVRLLPKNTPNKNQFIHFQGSDCREGKALLPTGTIINSAVSHLLYSCGKMTIKVARQPKVTFVSTGNETVPPDAKPLPHQIRQSNAPNLADTVRNQGYHFASSEHWLDDESEILNSMERLISLQDVIVISGGLSKGKKDFVAPVLAQLGAERLFHGVKQRPGKPMGFWKKNNCHIFGLPGNPVSTLVGFHRYVWPSLLRLQGAEKRTGLCTIAGPLNNQSPLTQFMPVLQTDTSRLRVLSFTNSGDFLQILPSIGIVEIPLEFSIREQSADLLFYHWL